MSIARQIEGELRDTMPMQRRDGLEVRIAPDPSTTDLQWLKTFGTYDGGGELMTEAWEKMQHIFAIRRKKDQVTTQNENDGPLVHCGMPNISNSFLNRNPVDLLVVERCSVEKAPSASYIHP